MRHPNRPTSLSARAPGANLKRTRGVAGGRKTRIEFFAMNNAPGDARRVNPMGRNLMVSAMRRRQRILGHGGQIPTALSTWRDLDDPVGRDLAGAAFDAVEEADAALKAGRPDGCTVYS